MWSILAFFMAAPFALAIHTDANCDEWRAFYDPMPAHHYSVTATLYVNEGGVWSVVEEQTGLQTLLEPGALYISGPWNGPLPTGEYMATFRVDVTPLNDPWGYSADLDTRYFNCEYNPPPPPPVNFINARTPGYWKNHASAWAVANLPIGGDGSAYAQSCLLDALSTPTRGDARVKLLHHLIAAKLNLLAGSDPVIQTVIDEADLYFTNSGSMDGSNCGRKGFSFNGGKPKGGEKAYVNGLKDLLDAYNNNQ
jgi:hypothetical protein